MTSTGAGAQNGPPYSLFNPVPPDKLRDFDPERPNFEAGPITVDAGHFQYEGDFFFYDYFKDANQRIRTVFGPVPSLKLGVTQSLEVELSLAPFVSIEAEDTRAGASKTLQGVSDLYFSVKYNLWGNDGGPSAAAIIPYIKIPTAKDGIGNGATEGGLILPVRFNLPQDISIDVSTEVDFYKNEFSEGYHLNYDNSIGITLPIARNLYTTYEIDSEVDVDPSSRVYNLLSFDVAFAWILIPNLQLDTGVDFGLTSDTPKIQVYSGVAKRF